MYIKDMKARTKWRDLHWGCWSGANRKEHIYQTFYESNGIAKYRR